MRSAASGGADLTTIKALKALPYSTQWIEESDIEAAVAALRSEWLTSGPALERFERMLADYCGAKEAVAVSSGTAALHLTCLALDLGPKKRLLTSTLTFVASANCALYCGAAASFADVDPSTGNMTAETLSRALAPDGADIVVPVHFGGRPADVERLASVAGGAFIVEDACHAMGAEYLSNGNWHRIGSCRHSVAAVFSFHPVKPMTTGEGGAILTNDSVLARRLKALRSHGIVRDPAGQHEFGGWYYEMRELGYNYRMTDIQAALGVAQLSRLNEGTKRRRDLAAMYVDLLGDCETISLPPEELHVRSAWHLFPVRVQHACVDRRHVYDALRERGIQAQVHYVPVHLHPYYRERFGFSPGQFPTAEEFYREEISLPLFATMTADDVRRVVDALREILVET